MAGKTIDAVRKTLRELAADVRVSLNVDIYDHISPGTLYSREMWFGQITLDKEEIDVDASAHTGAELVRLLKQKLALARKHKKQAKRIAHQPKLIEYKGAM